MEIVQNQIEEAIKPNHNAVSNVTHVTSVTTKKNKELLSNKDDNGNVTFVTEELSIWPDEEDRPCYRVYDDWFTPKTGSKKKRPGVYYHGLKETKDSI